MRFLNDFHDAVLWGETLYADLIQSKKLGYLISLAAALTLVTGLTLFLIDPNIKSPIDGVWSAWVTMTHVGFGDVVPISFLGRLLAAGLILIGLVFFSLFTALVSVTLIGKNIELMGEGVRRIETETTSISQGENRILDEIAKLQKRLDELEEQLPAAKKNLPSAE